ncbi:ubiquitin-like small modifier protein 1 [Halorarius halobius]|uniref:ubiquitin-like small modifier protein 1 n=1 Tax=Halorarius halobius TaxID=2962671 RepID=UPI0020CEFEFE|nr:ubiquitin-like small modifier protein 1 [Halorarius halobius]
MQVDCEFYATVRDAVGTKRRTREFEAGTTVREALHALADAHEGLGPLLFDGDGDVRPTIAVSVNGDPVGEAFDRVLSGGDTLIVAPGVAGG